jgi:hypothetical protein
MSVPSSRLFRWGRRLGLDVLDLSFLGLRAATLGAGFIWYALASDRTTAPHLLALGPPISRCRSRE